MTVKAPVLSYVFETTSSSGQEATAPFCYLFFLKPVLDARRVVSINSAIENRNLKSCLYHHVVHALKHTVEMSYSDLSTCFPPQRCPGQWALFGAIITPGCAASSTGAGTHSPVAQRPGQSLDRQCWIFTVSQVWIHPNMLCIVILKLSLTNHLHLFASTETSTPTSSVSRRTMMPTSLWTTTITTLPLVTITTTTTLPQLLARGYMQPTRPSCSKGDQWVSNPTIDPSASHSGWDSPVVLNTRALWTVLTH